MKLGTTSTTTASEKEDAERKVREILSDAKEPRETRGPAIHAADSMLTMLKKGEALSETQKYTLLVWSPWQHHFVIGEYESPEKAVILGTNWEPGRHFYYTLLPPGEKLSGRKDEPRELILSMENMEAAINPETLEIPSYLNQYGQRVIPRG